jgi:hypothetical protein
MADGELGRHLTGRYRVRVFRPAWGSVDRLFKRVRDKIEIRSQALKLRFWPEKHPEENGKLLDLDWSWIEAAKPLKIGELRIDDSIGGHDNLRIIFFCGERLNEKEMPIIWILDVMQKKRMALTSANLATFKGRRTLVMERYYKNREFL